VINTHHHGDHTYGNYLLPGATIVAHEKTRTELLAAGPPANHGIWNDVEWGDVQRTAVPDLRDERDRLVRRPALRGPARRRAGAHHERLDRLDL